MNQHEKQQRQAAMRRKEKVDMIISMLRAARDEGTTADELRASTKIAHSTVTEILAELRGTGAARFGGSSQYGYRWFIGEVVATTEPYVPELPRAFFFPPPAPPYNCRYCGAPSWHEPSDQTAPPDYCHEADHGEPEMAY